MSKLRDAAQRALEALEDRAKQYPHMQKGYTVDAISALRAALAEQPGYKLVPEVPTNEWIHKLARRQTGSFEDVPFAEIHQCIAELLDTAPEAPQSAKLAEQEPVAWIDITDEGHIVSSPRMYSDESREERTLYTAPQPRRRLTDEFLRKLHHIDEFGLFCDYDDFEQIARAIEAAHGIGEHE